MERKAWRYGRLASEASKNMKLIFFLSLLLAAVSSCTPTGPGLRVAIAANLTPPMEAIQAAYEAKSGIRVELSSGSSGALSAQIRNGAPFDLYLSANELYPQQLFAEGIGEEPPRIFARGQLVFWSAAPMEADSIAERLLQLGDKRLALPDPELAPYGAAAKTWLQSQGLWDKLSDRLIIGNNISHTNQIIKSGAVEVAFTAASARYWSSLEKEGHWLAVSGIAPIPHAMLLLSDREAVSSFASYLQSAEAASIFERFGYE